MQEEKKDRRKTGKRAAEIRQCGQLMKRLLIGVRVKMEDELRGEGVTMAQIKLLHAVRDQTGVAAAELARACYVTPQTMQTLLRRTEREGLITRSKSRSNDRILTTALTAAGTKLLERGEAISARIEESIWQDVRTSEMRQIAETIKRCLTQLEEEARPGADPLLPAR